MFLLQQPSPLPHKTEEQITLRMERAVWEMEQRHWYDYVVVNDDAQACADEILNIISELEEQ